MQFMGWKTPYLSRKLINFVALGRHNVSLPPPLNGMQGLGVKFKGGVSTLLPPKIPPKFQILGKIKGNRFLTIFKNDIKIMKNSH